MKKWIWSGANECTSGWYRKMLNYEPTLAIGGFDTTDNEPFKFCCMIRHRERWLGIVSVPGFDRVAAFLGVQPFPAGFAPVRKATHTGLNCTALNVSCAWFASQSACKAATRGAALLFFRKTRAAYRKLRAIALSDKVGGRSVFEFGFNETCPSDHPFRI